MYMNRYNNRPFYYSQIRINPLNDQRVYVLTTTIQISEDGGRTFHTGGIEFEGGLDFHAMWIDPTHGDRYYLGKDKGLTLTFDHGDTFILFDNMPIGQFYAVGVDMRDPYYVYGGTQDNGTWGGPSFSRDVRGILADSWWKLHWGDGMFIQIDPTDWRKVYTEAENGSFRRYDPLTRRVEFARPNRNNIVNYSDVISSRRDERGEREDGRPPFRFNWRAPLVMSPHNPQTLYLGGNHLFMTVDEGVHWKIISPDLSTNDDEKTNRESGGLTRDVTGAETHCSITSISESPVVPGLIWAGTDDGNVQVTRDGGARWENVRKRIKWISSDSWVSCVEASHFDPGTCYVTFDGHRSADFSTWICKTTDYGKTWNSISDNIPHGHSMYVVREDLKNRDLLFAGSEFTCFASLDGGKTWHRFMNNMPTVAFHDLVIHPRDGDLIAATHGRSFWILDDITPLQQLNDEILESEAHIFEQRPATIWEDASRGGVRGHFYFAGDNPPYIPENRNFVRGKLTSGGLVSYYLKLLHPGDVQIEICDFTGQKKRTLFASGEPGINRVLWDLRYDPSENQKRRFVQQMENLLTRIESMPALTSYQTDWIKQVRGLLQTAKSDRDLNQIREDLTDEFGHIFALRRAFGNALQGDPVEPGDYLIKMNVNGDTVQGTITVREDPILESGKDD
jgi:hypothetical protein